MNEQDIRQSLKPYMSNAEIDRAIRDMKFRDRHPIPPRRVAPKPPEKLIKGSWFEEFSEKMLATGSAKLHDRIRATYTTIPHGPEPRDRQRLSSPSIRTERPCFRCGAARECDCA